MIAAYKPVNEGRQTPARARPRGTAQATPARTSLRRGRPSFTGRLPHHHERLAVCAAFQRGNGVLAPFLDKLDRLAIERVDRDARQEPWDQLVQRIRQSLLIECEAAN